MLDSITKRNRNRITVCPVTMRCKTCGESKLPTAFYERGRGFGYPLRKQCILCRQLYYRRWRISIYGITLEEKEVLWKNTDARVVFVMLL